MHTWMDAQTDAHMDDQDKMLGGSIIRKTITTGSTFNGYEFKYYDSP